MITPPKVKVPLAIVTLLRFRDHHDPLNHLKAQKKTLFQRRR